MIAKLKQIIKDIGARIIVPTRYLDKANIVSITNAPNNEHNKALAKLEILNRILLTHLLVLVYHLYNLQ